MSIDLVNHINHSKTKISRALLNSGRSGHMQDNVIVYIGFRQWLSNLRLCLLLTENFVIDSGEVFIRSVIFVIHCQLHMDNALHEKWSFTLCYNSAEIKWSQSLFERDHSMCMWKDAIQGFLLLIICFKFLLYRIYCTVVYWVHLLYMFPQIFIFFVRTLVFHGCRKTTLQYYKLAVSNKWTFCPYSISQLKPK